MGASRMPRRDMPVYRSGFWAIVPFGAEWVGRTALLSVEALLAGGAIARIDLGEVKLEGAAQPAPWPAGARRAGPSTVAICMATHNPEPSLFAAQVSSIREQSDRDWVCVISDDGSDPQSLRSVSATVEGDDRFVLVPSKRRLGFYRNFERALELAPRSAGLLALADHDDRWFPQKLTALRESIGNGMLAYSDQRLVSRGGRVLAETYWTERRNNYTNFASMLITNTVTGAASLLRRELLDYALPFPAAPGSVYHDHWLALTALATGEIVYLDRPLYDYVQHTESVIGHAGANLHAGGRGEWISKLRRGNNTPAMGWRAIYFQECCRLRLMATVLLMRCSERLTAGRRRVLERFLRLESSPASAGWLLGRSARALVGRNETLGGERLLATGFVWQLILKGLVAGHHSAPLWLQQDASPPPGYAQMPGVSGWD